MSSSFYSRPPMLNLNYQIFTSKMIWIIFYHSREYMQMALVYWWLKVQIEIARILISSTGWQVYTEEWSPYYPVGRGSSGQFGMCPRPSKFCDEQLLHQPSLGSDWTVDQAGSIQTWSASPSQKGTSCFLDLLWLKEKYM